MAENENIKNLTYLLKEINLIRERYTLIEGGKETFNIFTTLMSENEEVCLHSRFISSLLDPKGPHGLGLSPLLFFLSSINSDLSFSENVEVIPNNDDWREHKEIDILIRDKANKSCIIIENKINAGDSNHDDRGQLEGYYQNQLSEGYLSDKTEVYYLSTDRHEPSQESVCTNNKTPELLEKVRCIDYSHEITSWLEKIASEVYSKPYLRETISQYLELIKNMTGDINIQERKDLASLVGKNDDNLCSAKLLLENFNHICWHTLFDFCAEIGQAIETNGFQVVSVPEENDITTIIHGGPIQRNKISLYFVFKDKHGISWSLASEADDDYGFWLGIEKAKNKGQAKELRDSIKEYAKDKDNNESWYCWRYIKDMKGALLYFWDFLMLDSDTFDLISPQKRERIIDHIVKCIISETKSFNKFV